MASIDKKVLAVFGVVILAGLWFLMTSGVATTSLCFNSLKGFEGAKCIDVEIVDNVESRRIGLSGRDSLGQDEGMFFVFDKEGEHAFWMGGMSFPLDIIWINKNKRVAYIAKNVPPCQESSCPLYKPGVNSLYVLEVNARFTGKYNITNDTQVFLGSYSI
ncbi:MAG: DUF192 domain-containing protein [Candidatus Altiarchaeota archaeon]|nr:DUF192 domain-containing protein [Candidatus Altiarchaeota archaeon]